MMIVCVCVCVCVCVRERERERERERQRAREPLSRPLEIFDVTDLCVNEDAGVNFIN